MVGKNEIVQFRADRALLAQLTHVAALRGLPIGSLVRSWVVDRLRSEFSDARIQWMQRRYSVIKEILAEEFPPGPVVVIHIQAPDFLEQLDVMRLASAGPALRMKGMHPIVSRINQYGYESFRRQSMDSQSPALAFAQQFKSGQIEIVALLDFQDQEIFGLMLENEIVLSILAGTGQLSGLRIPMPYRINMSLLRAKGFWLVGQPSMLPSVPHVSIEVDELELPEIEIDDLSQVTSSEDLAKYIKPVLDEIWNASGIARSLGFDSNGKWHGPWIGR